VPIYDRSDGVSRFMYFHLLSLGISVLLCFVFYLGLERVSGVSGGGYDVVSV